jgi:hypothetical protein
MHAEKILLKLMQDSFPAGMRNLGLKGTRKFFLELQEVWYRDIAYITVPRVVHYIFLMVSFSMIKRGKGNHLSDDFPFVLS